MLVRVLIQTSDHISNTANVGSCPDPDF
jgi:hypothetical protein